MPDSFDLSTFLPYRLAVASERVSRRLAEEYGRDHGLTTAEWRVLMHLTRSGEDSVRDIQDAVNLEKSRVSRAVSRLEEAGLVKKRQVKKDGRLISISLTSAGCADLASILPAVTQVEATLLADVPKDELEIFFRVLEQFHATLDADPKAKPRSRADLEGKKAPHK